MISQMLRAKSLLIALSCLALWSSADCFGQFQIPEIKPPKIPTIKPPKVPEIKPPKVPPIKPPDLKKLDPVAAAKRELERASNAAIRDLKKLDPQTVLSDIKTSVSQKLQREMQKNGLTYDARTGVLDLRKTVMGQKLSAQLATFSQGNKRKSEIEEFTYNVRTRLLTARFYVRHCQSWGKSIPGMGAVDLYSITQTARFTFDFRNNSADYDINPGRLGPRYTKKSYEAISEGNLVEAAQIAAPQGVGVIVNFERSNQYSTRLAEYHQRYGSDKVYFASKEFVDWATPETIGKYIVNGVISGGTSVYPQIMKDARKRAEQELPGLSAWLQHRGINNGQSVARELLTGNPPRWPHLKFEMLPVRYSAREKPLNAVTTPWRHVNHLAFVIIWSN